MRRFKWIEWNLRKIAAHSLAAEEVEAAFDRIIRLEERRNDAPIFVVTAYGKSSHADTTN